MRNKFVDSHVVCCTVVVDVNHVHAASCDSRAVLPFEMKCVSLCLFAVFLATVQASLEGVPDGWYETAKASTNEPLTITFAIKQANVEWLEAKLKAVSYPSSPDYTNYMNFDEIADHVYGQPESVQALLKTLASAGISESSARFTLGRDFAVVDMPVVAAEQLFSTDFYHYQHEDYPELTTMTSPSFKLPASLVGHVDFVSGVSSFPKPVSRPIKRKSEHTDMSSVTPTTLAKDYNTSNYVATNDGNSQGIAAFLKQYYDPTDLAKFQKRFDLPVKPIAKEVGKNIPDDPGAEANLDVQYISATGRGVDTWFISISTYSNGRQEDFLSWILGQINTTNSPWVHSASYGDVESSIESDYIQRMDNEFMKFGISGRTVLFATGDSGVQCRKGKFTPDWPTSSPYVTAVGGTVTLEEVWSDGGGGFSNVFPMPDYQKQVVEAYLKSGNAPSTKQFNPSGRAYPDVSAFAVNFEIIDDGLPLPVDGTSCAAPTFAGIVSILNDVRLNSGKKTLGFLNPLLYQTLMGQGFFDVTEGTNGNGFSCHGFRAVKGWDPASGWGSPNFGILKSLV